MSVRILCGDVRVRLAELPDESVHCVVTSPPYFGLRDYGTATWEGGDAACDHTGVARRCDIPGRTDKQSTQKGSSSDRVSRSCLLCGATRVDSQIGLEETPAAFVAVMVDVFREVRRVLRSDGTCWINLGDSYNANQGAGFDTNQDGGARKAAAASPKASSGGLPPKNLLGIPWRVAFALQADGWYLRQDIIWAKPNPMPESVTDRCTKAHEYLFLLSKSARYHYDAAAIAEAASYDPEDTKFPDGWDTGAGGHGSFHRNGREKGRASGNKTHKGVTEYESSDSEEHRTKAGLLKISQTAYPTRNRRSVWTVATQGFTSAHFATFPPALIEPCIMAGCPKGGTVLDPFFGAGTTGMVAHRLGRDCIGIELNPAYAEMARRRIHGDSTLFAEVTVAADAPLCAAI